MYTYIHVHHQCFGVAVSYLVIVGDLMPLAVREWAGHAPEGPSVPPSHDPFIHPMYICMS